MINPLASTRYRRTGIAAAVAAGTATVLVLGLALQGASAASADLPVSAVTASEDDGNVPANTRDDNLATRWSAESINRDEWIRFDLGSAKSVHYLQVAWYQGNTRNTEYRIQVSADAASWTTVRSGQSSGTTTGFETYDFTDITGRYVQIVSNGNTDNDWVSITEVNIFGDSGGTPSPSPTAPSPTASPSTPPAGTDPNGVRQIYPTRAGKAPPWTLGYDDWSSRFSLDGGSVSGSGKTTVITNSGQVRMSVKAVGSSTCEGITDQARALAQGYMCSPNDWTNWELTGYVQLVSAAGTDGDQDWTWYGNGGRHPSTGDPCTGSAYKGSYHYNDATLRFSKENPHNDYWQNPWQNITGGIDYTQNKSKWLGMKLIRYQFTSNGQRAVRLEMWLDFTGIDSAGNPANNWRKISQTDDTGNWGGNASECNLSNDFQVMLWGGPTVTYRWDNTTSNLRLASAREIVPPLP